MRKALSGFVVIGLSWNLAACAPEEPAASPLSPPPPVVAEPAPVPPPPEPPAAPPPPELSPAQTVKLYQDCWAAVNAKDFAKLAPCYADDAVSELVDTGAPPAVGKDIAERQVREFVQAFPDLTAEAQLTLGNGNRVLGVWLVKGTHQGTLPTPVGEVQPTNKRVLYLLAQLVEVEGGRAVKAWSFSDSRTLLGQLGVLPGKVRKIAEPAVAEKPVVLAAGTPTETENLETYKRYVSAFNAHEMKAIEPLLSNDFVYSDQASPADLVGRKEAQRGMKEVWKAMSDVRVEPKTVWAAGDYVVATSTFSGTNDGPLPALKLWEKTDKKVSLNVLEVLKFQDGKVRQHWVFSNGLAFANQLGLAPPVKPVKPLEPPKPAPPAKPTEPSKPVEPARPSPPAPSGAPAKPAP